MWVDGSARAPASAHRASKRVHASRHAHSAVRSNLVHEFFRSTGGPKRSNETVLMSENSASASVNVSAEWSCPGLRFNATEHSLLPISWLHVPKCGTSFLATIMHYACRNSVRGGGNYDRRLKLGVGPRGKRRTRAAPALGTSAAGLTTTAAAAAAAQSRCPLAGRSTPTPALVRPLLGARDHLPFDLRLDVGRVVTLLRRPNQRLLSAFFHDLHADGLTDRPKMVRTPRESECFLLLIPRLGSL
jgi:hypothetical protein